MPKISSMETCYVLFGSNQGDKEAIFAQACLLINNRCGRVVQVSSAYESEPWGFESEDWFLNRAVVVEIDKGPEEVLHLLLDIERELGRVRHPEIQGYTSRTADLDILYFGTRIVHTNMLTVPHPRVHLRRFALMPMCEVAPELVHPVFAKTQEELLRQCPDECIVRRVPTCKEETI